MDENSNVNEDSGLDKKAQEKQHTEQNAKEGVKAIEKGVALYAAGPEGVAAVNAIHNAPIIGKYADKIVDREAKKIAKNPFASAAMNKLGDSGITNAANKGLDAVGTAGGGGAGGAASASGAAAGASSSATSAAKGINEGLGKIPAGLGGTGGSGDSDGPGGSNGSGGSGGGDDDRSPSERTVGAVKKAGKILKMISPALPFIGGAIVTILVVVMVMAEVMVIRDKIVGAIVTVMKTEQKLQNFVTGDGWYTEDEAFFSKLKLKYQEFNSSSKDGELLDLPLIAATIHYSKVTDMDVWDGDEPKEESVIGENENNYTDEQDSGIGSSIVETYQTWSFYQVANAKLGSWGSIIPGSRGLLGHLVKTEFGTETICVWNVGEIYTAWSDFLKELFQFPDWTDYAAAYGTTPEAVSNFVSSLIAFPTGIDDLITFYDNVVAFASQDQSYPEWWMANVAYELKEFALYLVGDLDDERLLDTPYSYYSNLLDAQKLKEGESGESFFTDLISFAKNSLSVIAGLTWDDDKKCVSVTVPTIEHSMDYAAYYRYLVNVYIPLTYFRNQEVDVDYSYLQVVETANAIFDQKYLYEYLVGEDTENLASGCDYKFSGSSSTTVSVDKDMIDNLYVNVMSASCGSITNCTSIEETVSLKDYVIGVVYREIGASISDNAEYLKANIIAAKSFTVGRRTATQNGTSYYINMINSTNDQVYCSVTKGCMDAASNRKPVPSAELLEYLGKLYDEVYNQFLYNSSSSSFTGYYRAKESQCIGANLAGSCLGQNESQEMGDAGKDFEAILGYFYVDPIGIVDISNGSFSVGVMQCISSGLELGTDGYYIRTTAPESTNIYFNAPYVTDSNRGQCVWYVKGRAQEIIANSIADASKKETAKNAIQSTYANGNGWFTADLQEVFGSSTDYTLPKVGAIAVYTWTDSHCADYWGGTCKQNYGHSLIVESVSGDTVTISQGYTSCSTGSPSWSCVKFDYSSHPISYMKDLGGNYKFIGYIYLLD